MMMRCFVAIDLPPDVEEKVLEIQKKLPEFKGKLTEKENLHLTLKFLGEIDEGKLGEVKKRLLEVKEKKFGAEIDNIGVFSENFIRIIWLHITNCEKLQKEIDSKLENLFPKEKRFMSHLTIARVKNITSRNEFLKKLKNTKIAKIKFVVDSFKLKKSTLTEKGPIYETLESYALG